MSPLQILNRLMLFRQITVIYYQIHTRHTTILWRIDPLLGIDLETNNEFSSCYAIGE
jgi:hypothetical protein